MASDRVQLLSTRMSPFAMRVLIALNLKGVQYEYYEEDLMNKSQILLASNPIHKRVPVLIHNGKAICESLNAVEYIDEVWPSEGKSFLPDDPLQRAAARFWADYIGKTYCEAANRVIFSLSEEDQEKAIKDVKDAYITLNSALREVGNGKPFFGGDSMGIVDIAFAPWICGFTVLEELGHFELPNAKECPHLSAWIAKVAEYPGVKEALALKPHEKALANAKIARKRMLEALWDAFEP